MSEVIPDDEDRGGDGAIGDALSGDTAVEEEEGDAGTGADDGGPGSLNM